VVELIGHDGCQVNALVGHFGERREAPCGHCSHCLEGRQVLPAPTPPPPIAPGLREQLTALRAKHPDALGEARQAARFLCGLTSPGLTRAKLGKHELFGALEAHRFEDVLRWAGSA
jgi:ATP-dependent DNA helicase RecQ